MTGSSSFTAYGEPLDASDTFGFAGEQQDPTGLQHLRARQYNPALGRFLSVDPIQPGAPGTTGWNLYSYTGNNPTTWTDPSGQIALTGEGQVLAGGVAVLAAFALASNPAYQQSMASLVQCLSGGLGCFGIHLAETLDGEEKWEQPGPVAIHIGAHGNRADGSAGDAHEIPGVEDIDLDGYVQWVLDNIVPQAGRSEDGTDADYYVDGETGAVVIVKDDGRGTVFVPEEGAEQYVDRWTD